MQEKIENVKFLTSKLSRSFHSLGRAKSSAPLIKDVEAIEKP